MKIGNAQFQDHKNSGAAGAPRPQTQWEYRTAKMDRDADLAQFGAEGWELVAVNALPNDEALFHFKRRK